jgi:hypothetical protein
MPILRFSAVRLFSALLILAILTAGHQHPLLAPAGGPVVSQADAAAPVAGKSADCVACRTLQASDLAAAVPAVSAAIAAAESFAAYESARLATQAEPRRSPRAPPASRA